MRHAEGATFGVLGASSPRSISFQPENCTQVSSLGAEKEHQERQMTATTVADATVRKETDSLGEVDVPSSKLWGAQTQRSLEHFSIGHDLIPREMIAAYAILKKAAANANHADGRLDDEHHKFIVQTCDEVLAGS